jgi:hypothetical protein
MLSVNRKVTESTLKIWIWSTVVCQKFPVQISEVDEAIPCDPLEMKKVMNGQHHT